MPTTKILVVEDESVVALDIQNRLIGLGYDVPTVAAYGEEAIRKAGQIRPDLVLMDIRIKGDMDGIETAEQIRSRFDIPVVYLTAYADSATLERAKVAEAFGYLLKPFKERELQTTIEMALYKHRMERKLKESQRWLSATLKSIGDAVIATDAEGTIQFMNPLAEGLTGWDQAEALGQDLMQVFNIVDGTTKEPRENLCVRVLQSGKALQLEDNTILIAKDGAQVPVEDSAAPIKDEKDAVAGMVLVFRDVTERVKAQEALGQHATELQARNEELDAFAHTVAHDLKNPVNLIVGFSEVLQTDHAEMPAEELKNYLEIIARNGLKISSIIDELLLLAGVRDMDVPLEPLDMCHIVAEAQDRLAHMLETHQTELAVPAQWPQAVGYGPWVEEVWVNYISNGIKYGGQPPRLKLGAKELANGSICFWIQDNGTGLTAEEQAKLFTPFTQLNKVRANGHGLGLSIVQRIVKKLNGQVGIVSQVGRGSIFTFTLPAAKNGSNGRMQHAD